MGRHALTLSSGRTFEEQRLAAMRAIKEGLLALRCLIAHSVPYLAEEKIDLEPRFFDVRKQRFGNCAHRCHPQRLCRASRIRNEHVSLRLNRLKSAAIERIKRAVRTMRERKRLLRQAARITRPSLPAASTFACT